MTTWPTSRTRARSPSRTSTTGSRSSRRSRSPGRREARQPPKPGSRQYDAVKQQVMQFLVSAKWIEGEAKERGVSATDAEVDAPVRADQGPVVPQREGLPALPEDLRPDRGGPPVPGPARRALQQDPHSRSPRSSQDVSDSEIEDYYNDNEQQFSQPERRDLEVILTKKQAEVLEAKQAVEGGEKWSKVAKEFSDDPASKEQGGKLLGVTKGQQDPKFDAASLRRGPEKVAGPIKTDAGYYVFRVTKVTKATKQSLEQSKQGIKQLLVSQKQQKELDQFSTNFRNDWRARTDCADGLRDRRLPQRPRAVDRRPRLRCRRASRSRCPERPGANPPALDGTGSNLAGGNGERHRDRDRARSRRGRRPVRAARRRRRRAQAPLALGGAPKEGAAQALRQAACRPACPAARLRAEQAASRCRQQGRQAAPAGPAAPARQLRIPLMAGAEDERLPRRCSSSTRSPAACGANVPGTASRTSAASSRTPSRRPTSWPTRRTRATTRSCWTSWATCCSRSTSSRSCSRSAAHGDLADVAAATREKLVRRHPHIFGERELAELPTDATTAAEVKQNWDAIKLREGRGGAPSPSPSPR